MEQTKEQNNRLIAEFMGWKYSKHGNTAYILNAKNKLSAYRLGDIHFNKSFDWLMPVVEKIEVMGFSFEIVKNRVLVYDKSPAKAKVIVADTKIEALYTAVVQFIKEINYTNK